MGFENMLFPVIQEILSNDVTGVWSICHYWHLPFPESLHLLFFKAYASIFVFDKAILPFVQLQDHWGITWP